MNFNDTWLPQNFNNFDKCFLNNQFILINIPKNASTTLRHTLHLSQRVSYPTTNTHKKIIIVRDPFQRIVSSFMELIKLRKDGAYLETASTTWFKLINSDLEKSFDVFLDYINNRLYDSHVHPQIEYIKRKNIELEEIDYILLFEDLKKDFKEMCKDLNISKKLQYHNKTHNNKYKDSLNNLIATNKDIRKKIEYIYTEDINLYKEATLLKINENDSNSNRP